jgi:putative glycosyltransferase
MYIEEFYTRISNQAQKITSDYEIIFVNDGTKDNSLEIATKLTDTDSKIKIINLSRNFGHHKAMMTGLQQAKSDYIFLIDSDLEEEPENLSKFWQHMTHNVSIDVVYGQQKSRKTPLLKRFMSNLFYLTFNALSTVKIKNGELVSRLMTRRYLNALISYQERELFIPALWVDAGFKQEAFPAEKSFNGNSNYTLKKQIILAVNAITSFSSKPLILIFYFGSIMFFGSMLYITYLVIQKLFFHQAAAGWTSLIASVYLLGGLIILSIGIIGVYLSKIYNEVKMRPYTIIKSIITKDKL